MQSAKGRLKNIADSFKQGLISDSNFIKNKCAAFVQSIVSVRAWLRERVKNEK